jgi:hypothetical protein
MVLSDLLAGFLLKGGKRAWLQVVLPTWLALTLLLGIGPWIQLAIAKSVSAQAPSIYSAVYGEGIASTPNLPEWLASPFQSYLAVVALLIILLSLSAPSRTSAVIRAMIGTCLVLTIADVIVAATNDELSSITESIIFNLIGSPIVGLFFGFLLFIIEESRSIKSKSLLRAVLYPTSAISAALVISIAAFVVYCLFYGTAPVNFSAIINLPTSGFFVSDEGSKKDPKKGDLPLQILPREMQASTASILSPGEQMIATWTKLDRNSTFSANISFYADCPYKKNITQLPKPLTSLTVNPEAISLNFTKGFSEIVTGHSGYRPYNLFVPTLAQYWMKADNNGNLSKISAFIDKQDVLSSSSGDAFSFYLAAPLSEIDEKDYRSISRTLSIKIDGETSTLTLKGASFAGREKLNCRSIRARYLSSNTREHVLTIPANEPMNHIGALVDVTYDPKPAETFPLNRSEFVISNSNGWAAVSGFAPEQLKDEYLGKGRGFEVEGNINRLTVEGETKEVVSTDELLMIGEVSARLNGGQLYLSGKSPALWLNHRRLNPTLWERLGVGWQIPLITAIFALLGIIVRWGVPRVRAVILDQRSFNIDI